MWVKLTVVPRLQVITDPANGRSKGYGFVRFANEVERDRALDMQGFHISNRPIRVSLATARRNPGPGGAAHPAEMDPSNTTLFIGGLSSTVSEDQLRAVFSQFGDVVYTKIPQGKGCGFVQFRDRLHAEVAMAELNGQILGTSAIRISWGRSTSRAAAAGTRPAGVPPPMPGFPPYGDPYAAGLPGPAAAAGGGPGFAYGAAPAAYGMDGVGGGAAGYPVRQGSCWELGPSEHPLRALHCDGHPVAAAAAVPRLPQGLQ